MNYSSFNEEYRDRTKKLALSILSVHRQIQRKEELRVIGYQLLKSSSSVAANFRATCRARSKAEFYAKLCIVVEECDETLFWLEMIEESGLIENTLLGKVKDETSSILQVLSKTKKRNKPG